MKYFRWMFVTLIFIPVFEHFSQVIRTKFIARSLITPIVRFKLWIWCILLIIILYSLFYFFTGFVYFLREAKTLDWEYIFNGRAHKRLIHGNPWWFVNNKTCLRKLLVSMLKYCYHATPNDETNKMIKLEQLAVYLEHPQEDVVNNFKCHNKNLFWCDEVWIKFELTSDYLRCHATKWVKWDTFSQSFCWVLVQIPRAFL
jgi:hypothetical protein